MKTFWGLLIALLLLTRVPLASQYLSIDNVNLAFALEKFDPRIHQPQPPGYPFFVAFSRAVNLIFHNPERTFLVVSLLVSALCLPVIYLLGARMFSSWAGRAAALLLLLNPVFWNTGLDSPLRPNLALFALLTALCCWRCWKGEKHFLIWGAIALGIGSGFRPDLLLYLFPLWLLSSWIGTKSYKSVAVGLAVLAGIVLVWVGALVLAVDGVRPLLHLTATYLLEQSRSESVILGARAWFLLSTRLLVWNGLGVIGWIWAIPIYFLHRDRILVRSSQGLFFMAWLLPGLTFQALVHVQEPGHTLFSAPALCLVGGYVLSLVSFKETALAFALVLDTLLFMGYLPLPPANQPHHWWSRAENTVAQLTFESSAEMVRWLDGTSRETLAEAGQFMASDRPSVFVTTDVHTYNWFMNWRIARYYLPQENFWVVDDHSAEPKALHIMRDRVLESRAGPSTTIPVPRGGRVLWLLENGAAFQTAAKTVQTLSGGPYIYYTDIAMDARPFAIDKYNFVPR